MFIVYELTGGFSFAPLASTVGACGAISMFRLFIGRAIMVECCHYAFFSYHPQNLHFVLWLNRSKWLIFLWRDRSISPCRQASPFFLDFKAAFPSASERVRRTHFFLRGNLRHTDSKSKWTYKFWNRHLQCNIHISLRISPQTMKTFRWSHLPPFYPRNLHDLQSTSLHAVRTIRHTHQYPFSYSTIRRLDSRNFLQRDQLLFHCNSRWALLYCIKK